MEAGPDGDPLEVRYSFDRSVDSPDMVWVAWDNGRFVPFLPPSEHSPVELPVSIGRYWMALGPIETLLGTQPPVEESIVLD